jgi:mannose-1-phosphate guanylyltransferase
MYCVVMAGGSGTRFWPKSRQTKAKQFLRILGTQSLIESTLSRFKKIVDSDKIYIVAKACQEALLREHAPWIPEKHLIFEPLGKNTAACIGLAAVHISRRDPDAVIVVSPADHLVKKEDRFCKVIQAAEKLAEERDAIVTIGIPPTRPSTGYGYIQINGDHRTLYHVDTYRIKTFAEKPNIETAERFLASGDFFWNSGIFVFKCSVILKAFEEHLPDLYESLMEIRDALSGDLPEPVIARIYQQLKNISIDYGVMEKARNVFMVKGNFVWDDLGSWDQVYKLSSQDKNGNSVAGNAVLLDTRNSYVASDRGVVAVLGLEDIVVVREGDAVLVSKRNRSEDVRHVAERLRQERLNDYL